MSEFYDDFDPSEYYEEEAEPKPRDRKVDEAKAVLMERYFSGGQDVYYSRQLHIWLETEFFHWITGKALNELAAEGQIGTQQANLGHVVAHFYYPRRHRYPARQIKATINLIQEFSDPQFTRALGHHGEMLVGLGFARSGFRILDQKVRSVDGNAWTDTKHDLDFLIERDGCRYGVEVKNQLGYIDQTEFETKLSMCEHFGIKPLFVCRQMPKNYMYDVYKKDGYSMITQNQNYPLLAGGLAKRVKDALSLPVATIVALPNTALHRFERFHQNALAV